MKVLKLRSAKGGDSVKSAFALTTFRRRCTLLQVLSSKLATRSLNSLNLVRLGAVAGPPVIINETREKSVSHRENESTYTQIHGYFG